MTDQTTTPAEAAAQAKYDQAVARLRDVTAAHDVPEADVANLVMHNRHHELVKAFGDLVEQLTDDDTLTAAVVGAQLDTLALTRTATMIERTAQPEGPIEVNP